MYKNLNATALGVSGRQSELIELSLTYSFRGFDVDIEDVAKRAKNHGVEHAKRFIDSADIKVGGFRLPVGLDAEDAVYQKDLERLPQLLEVAATLGASNCFTHIQPASDELPYHENFERHRKRLAEIAALLAPHELRLGVGFSTIPAHREGHEYQFIFEAEPLLLLLKSVGTKNVGLLLDLFHWHVGGGSANRLRELTRDKIVIVWLADLADEADPKKIVEKDRVLPKVDGRVDAVGALRLLTELEYEGPVTLAPYPRQFTGKTRDAIIQQASDLLDELWREAGIGRLPKSASSPEVASKES